MAKKSSEAKELERLMRLMFQRDGFLLHGAAIIDLAKPSTPYVLDPDWNIASDPKPPPESLPLREFLPHHPEPEVTPRARRLHAAQLLIGMIREEGSEIRLNDGEIQINFRPGSLHEKAMRLVGDEVAEVLRAEGEERWRS